MVSADMKYEKALLLLIAHKVKRTFKGFDIDYFNVAGKNVVLGTDSITGKDRTGCDCMYESNIGAKKSLACSHLIAAVIYKAIKGLMNKKQIRVQFKDLRNEFKELKLADEKLEG